MGCDIHSYAEVRTDGKWQVAGEVFPLDDFAQKYEGRETTKHPFDCRNYGWFGFLAGVRNYSHTPVIQEPSYDIPEDASPVVREAYASWSGDAHSASCISANTLLDYDYSQSLWDRRVTKQTSHNSWNGAAIADEGEAEPCRSASSLGRSFSRTWTRFVRLAARKMCALFSGSTTNRLTKGTHMLHALETLGVLCVSFVACAGLCMAGLAAGCVLAAVGGKR